MTFTTAIEADDGAANIVVRADDARLDGRLGDQRQLFNAAVASSELRMNWRRGILFIRSNWQ